ncbi:N-acetylmuramoyl-L-alanine amidase [Saccharibacillus sp. CPCC 101409]|uniref:N-acetylmuramoyl-L-alanine amidase n=1 Tax=Saccharibacillus sp. CPCC 101409 TaxID=3058041 RepID=UPI002672D2C7|nr:N-acetylmuramoyl-L-alanine amidase [Saccharibacillus sp. CPCC 101409]MDO3411634.1 N-acetylmuramoyl-L-alanine amidase [Saccharibacillus sp. CPCC 101409]
MNRLSRQNHAGPGEKGTPSNTKRRFARRAGLAMLTLAAGVGGLFPYSSGPVYAEGSSYTAKVYTDSLNVRSKAGPDTPVIGSLKSGEVVNVTDELLGWLKVENASTSGWVAGYYLKKEGAAAVSTGKSASGSAAGSKGAAVSSGSAKVATGSKALVTANSVIIRSGPGKKWEMLGSANRKDAVTVLENQNGWTRIMTSYGAYGWVSSQYLQGGGAAKAVSATQHRKAATVSSAAAKSEPADTSDIQSGSLKGKLIVLDPGHGGDDPGTVGTSHGLVEGELNLQTALYVRDYLVSRGARVEMTRTQNSQRPSLAERAQLAPALGADAFVSIHYNSALTSSASGTLVCFYSESKDIKLARALEAPLKGGIGLRNNGLAFGNFKVIRENSVPAVLLEMGFLSNPSDESVVGSADYQRKAAKAVADGLQLYFSN